MAYSQHRLPRAFAHAVHPGGRKGLVRRPFGDPIAVPSEHPRFIAPPPTNRVNLVLPLQAVMADDWIVQAGKIIFHAAGDTGGIHGTDSQEAIADAMQSQYETAPEAAKPAFFYNLGDVVYYNGQSADYDSQFYEPYAYYTPPIFAIPGNHDGDTKVQRGDAPLAEPSLYGFMQNFCDEQPRTVSHGRETLTQPYVYWTLDAPFVTIIGLYSNVDGLLDGPGSIEQQRWFEDQLRAAPQDKCLIVAVHHPPYSLDRPHGGSPRIVAAIDQGIHVSGRAPDAVLSGHVHSYQRFSREISGKKVPFVVAGCAGYANRPGLVHKLQKNPKDSQPIAAPFATTEAGVVLEACDDTNPGFLRITVTETQLIGEYFPVPFAGAPHRTAADHFTLTWKKHAPA